jgi:hypothetical protein
LGRGFNFEGVPGGSAVRRRDLPKQAENKKILSPWIEELSNCFQWIGVTVVPHVWMAMIMTGGVPENPVRKQNW